VIRTFGDGRGFRHALFATAITATLLITCFGRQPTRVTVVNRTGDVLTLVEWEYTGGTHSVETIADGEAYDWIATPSAPTALRMRYTDHGGTERAVEIDVYMEPTLGGAIRLVILPDGSIDVGGLAERREVEAES